MLVPTMPASPPLSDRTNQRKHTTSPSIVGVGLVPTLRASPRTLLSRTLLPCAAVKRTPPTERTIQSMTLNNPPDQPSVEQITTKNNFSYTSHDHHPLTGTSFPENNTAIPTTPATLTHLTTLA